MMGSIHQRGKAVNVGERLHRLPLAWRNREQIADHAIMGLHAFLSSPCKTFSVYGGLSGPISHPVLTTFLCGKELTSLLLCSHYADVETEAQRGVVTYPRSHREAAEGPRLRLRCVPLFSRSLCGSKCTICSRSLYLCWVFAGRPRCWETEEVPRGSCWPRCLSYLRWSRA